MALIEEDPNARFEKAMFNLLRSFNYIDHNLGLSISFLAEPRSPKSTYNKLSNISFDQRMKWFKKLITANEVVGEKVKEEFVKWTISADKARELRNMYVHAIWRFNPSMRGKPVNISSPIWMRDKLGDDVSQDLSLDELERNAADVDKIFKDFIKIRRKYNFF